MDIHGPSPKRDSSSLLAIKDKLATSAAKGLKDMLLDQLAEWRPSQVMLLILRCLRRFQPKLHLIGIK